MNLIGHMIKSFGAKRLFRRFDHVPNQVNLSISHTSIGKLFRIVNITVFNDDNSYANDQP